MDEIHRKLFESSLRPSRGTPTFWGQPCLGHGIRTVLWAIKSPYCGHAIFNLTLCRWTPTTKSKAVKEFPPIHS